ncbi:hypothetical protein F4779DRAFT_629738 [Xylariaceae sp. FL0662B]|nr:hypothetical protein F4779DRAFT_629738 [Xylariaceae sp. FL0662B]
MNNRTPRTGLGCPRVKLSRSLLEQLLNAVAREHPPDQSITYPTEASLPDMKSKKRQLDEIDQSAAKRPRLSTEVEGERAQPQPANETTIIQHPTPKKPSYAVFLERCVEPSQPWPCSGSPDSFISAWLESVGSDRNTRCRSDSCLDQPTSEPVPRQDAYSAPQMGHARDAGGFTLPPAPASTGPRSRVDIDSASVTTSEITSGSSRTSARSPLEGPFYRAANLAANNIYMRRRREELPEGVAELVNYVRRGRDSPGPSPDQVWQDPWLEALELMPATKFQVEDYFRANIFPSPGMMESLQHSDGQPMAKHTVPNASSELEVSNPVPDLLYGYNVDNAFSRQQQSQLFSMGPEMLANSRNLVFPFFVVEFKSDGLYGRDGSLWVVINQCLGDAASCVNVTERLNIWLAQCESDEVRPINSAAFSIAMSGAVARLYVSWKHDEQYYMRKVKSFLLQCPDGYLEFRKYVRNIIDWGKDRRLSEIRSSLDTLLAENRKRISEVAKSRPPPSYSSGARRAMPMDRSYWGWDETYRRWFHVMADGSIMWAEEEDGQASGVPL